MSEAERDRVAREKAQKLVNWFEGKPLPVCPFVISPAVKVLSVEKHLEVCSATVLHAKPYKQVFMSAYNHLLILKKYMENEAK
jgi:hypothetical protein